MRPPICDVCGARPAESDSDLKIDSFATLAFVDHMPLPPGMTGRPDATPWLCGPHLAQARPMRGLLWDQARSLLLERRLPPEATEDRTTPSWDATGMPGGLRRAHQIAAGVWGRLDVHAGSAVFAFEDAIDDGPWTLTAGDAVVIPPQRPHHVEPGSDVELSVTFFTT
jgi:tellurite resistance-related uncharacterized protein